MAVKVIVLDRAAYRRIVAAIPKSWLGDESLRANVAFVRRGTNAKEVVRQLDPEPAIEEVKAINGAILWATKRSALNRGVMRKLIGGAAYKKLTVRIPNTTLKLDAAIPAMPGRTLEPSVIEPRPRANGSVPRGRRV